MRGRKLIFVAAFGILLMVVFYQYTDNQKQREDFDRKERAYLEQIKNARKELGLSGKYRDSINNVNDSLSFSIKLLLHSDSAKVAKISELEGLFAKMNSKQLSIEMNRVYERETVQAR
jgi:HEPN domain-containing protein